MKNQNNTLTNPLIYEKAFRNNQSPKAITEEAAGLYLDVNDAFRDTTGYDSNEIIAGG